MSETEKLSVGDIVRLVNAIEGLVGEFTPGPAPSFAQATKAIEWLAADGASRERLAIRLCEVVDALGPLKRSEVAIGRASGGRKL